MFKRVVSIVALCFFTLAIQGQDNNVTFTSSNLPIVVLDTHGAAILDDPKIAAEMGIIDNGLARNNVTDPFNNFSGKIGIEIRGSSSQMFPKKQYGVELQDDAGAGKEASLLGLPPEEDWILFAPYNDKSLMRDALSYRLGRAIGRYTPRTKFCEVVLNGVYQGVYVLMEKIKRDKFRVDINKLDPDEITGNNLTGGYIVKIDKTTGSGGSDGWTSAFKAPLGKNSQGIDFLYEYPKAEDIAVEQKQYIKKFVDDFEAVLSGSNFRDPVNGYAKYIDVNSFVDFLIMQEITKNVDGYRLSTFFYKQRDSDGGKLVMGPLWDFNLGFGNADYCTRGNPEGFVLEFNDVCGEDSWLIPFWWKRLLTDEAFGATIASRWAELRATKFQETTIDGYIDSVATVLNLEAQQRNFTAWQVLNKYVWPNYYVGPTFQAEVNWLKDWTGKRLDWLDQNFPALITATEGEMMRSNSLSTHPNPFSSEVNFEYQTEGAGPVTVQIYDALGRLTNSSELNADPGNTGHYVWRPVNAAGIYYYQVKQGTVRLGQGKLFKK